MIIVAKLHIPCPDVFVLKQLLSDTGPWREEAPLCSGGGCGEILIREWYQALQSLTGFSLTQLSFKAMLIYIKQIRVFSSVVPAQSNLRHTRGWS